MSKLPAPNSFKSAYGLFDVYLESGDSMEDTILLQKEVDKSVLFQGLTIPQAFHDLFFERIGFRLAHGEKRKITAGSRASVR